MSTLREDWPVLAGLLPSDWEPLGRSSGGVRRLRGFDSVHNVRRTLLLHVGCGGSLRETAVQAKWAGLAEVSDVPRRNRLRQAEAWLQALCQQLWKDKGVNLEPALKGRPVRLVDGTTVKEPGKTGGTVADSLQSAFAKLGLRSVRSDAGAGEKYRGKVGSVPFAGRGTGDGRGRLL